MDNILEAFEIMHTINTKTQGMEGLMAFKLDMTKAFDRVEWGFLEKIMLKLGFASRWVHLILMCITTATFSVKVNGQPRGHFKSTRGVRQGDPLSPYFFILCAEGLSHKLKKGEADSRFQGIAACRKGPRINHIFFTVDSLIFSRATEDDSRNLMQVLKDYERILDGVGVEGLQRHEKYLGLPALIGKSQRKILNYLRDNVRRKIGGWKEKVLS